MYKSLIVWDVTDEVHVTKRLTRVTGKTRPTGSLLILIFTWRFLSVLDVYDDEIGKNRKKIVEQRISANQNAAF